MFLLFEGVAVTLWLTKSNLFYLFNFSYIGSCLSVGLALFTAGKRYARQFVQLAVGLYMLVYLGLMSQENMQIEGFWYYLFSGVFEAATIHYAVAKIFGPLLFGRGWCGYACWTAMVLDLLPFKVPQKPRKEKLGTLRYVMFALSFALVSALFLMKFSNLERIMFWLFLIGNILYYAGGIALAFIFKDNRAFCKYLCPITVFLKPMSYFSLLRVHCDESKCVQCGKCLKVCPMNVEVNKESRKRKNATECILCMHAPRSVPKKRCTKTLQTLYIRKTTVPASTVVFYFMFSFTPSLSPESANRFAESPAFLTVQNSSTEIFSFIQTPCAKGSYRTLSAQWLRRPADISA